MPSLVLLLHVDAPPLKKRRGLAGSIVSTAVSAALIGTAVGLTVYRLWRDRGKEGQLTQPSASSSASPSETEQVPPPPYDAGAWKPIEQPPAVPVVRALPAPATPRTAAKSKKAVGSKRAVGGGHHHHSSSGSTRRARARYGGAAAAGGGAAVVGSPRARPEFDFGRVEVADEGVVGQGMGMGQEQTEVEDQMDWIGDKLSALIEQGRRALQSEVVVMSEAKEDEVDDGRGGWEEENSDDDDAASRRGRSRAGSVRGTKPRPRNIIPPPPPVGLGIYGAHTSASASGSGSISASPRMTGFTPSAPGSVYATPSTSYTNASAFAGFAPSSAPSSHRINGHVRGISYESALPSTTSVSVAQEDPMGWESPELRESMERARARLLARRAGGGVV